MARAEPRVCRRYRQGQMRVPQSLLKEDGRQSKIENPLRQSFAKLLKNKNIQKHPELSLVKESIRLNIALVVNRILLEFFTSN